MTDCRDSIEFFAEGTPEPQGSHRAFNRGGKAVVVQVNSTAHKRWRKAVAAAAKATVTGPAWDEPVRVEIDFWLPTVQVDPFRSYASRKPDLDKLCRSVLDSLTDSGLIVDDARVVELVARKTHTSTGKIGARVTVRRLAEHERRQSQGRAILARASAPSQR